MYTIIFKPEAEEDLDEIFNWYDDCREGLGYEFLISLDECVTIIQANPLFSFNVSDTVRRATLSRFPYAVYYTIENNTVYIHVIMHQFRDPDEWQKRI
jgi:toxin ParE1/3/4